MLHRLPLVLSLAAPALAAEIQHRFLMVDDGTLSLHYVNQADTTKNWTVKFGGYCMDMQLIGQDRVLLAVDDGYREFALADGKELKAFRGLGGKTHTVERLQDGRTLLGGRDFKGLPHGIVILGPDDKEQARFALPNHRWIRHLRTTPRGTLLIAAESTVSECKLDGTLLWSAKVPGNNFKAVELDENRVLVSSGPGGRTLREIDHSGKVLKTLSGQDLPAGAFAGFQRLANGNLVIANWLGHGSKHDGTVLYEYDADGKVVWKYGIAKASSVEVIVLDDLDTSKLHVQQSNAVLAPPAAK
jgi:outer membrane protein assembly factor BamB